jgi:pyridoxamine 5'-phosphate oxidase
MHFSEYTDPQTLFTDWFAEVQKTQAITEKTAMALATTTKAGEPSVRIVLLKDYDARGFVFYTNLDGRKSRELKENPKAALCFYWMALDRQVRIEGKVEQVSGAEADAYYNSRSLISRIGAHASKQSEPLESREVLLNQVKELEKKYSDTNPPPRPANWSGWRVIPSSFEFWQQGDYRLHDRIVFTKSSNGWDKKRLYP